MWHALLSAATASDVLDALAAMPALRKLTFVVQTQVGGGAAACAAALRARAAGGPVYSAWHGIPSTLSLPAPARC